MLGGSCEALLREPSTLGHKSRLFRVETDDSPLGQALRWPPPGAGVKDCSQRGRPRHCKDLPVLRHWTGSHLRWPQVCREAGAWCPSRPGETLQLGAFDSLQKFPCMPETDWSRLKEGTKGKCGCRCLGVQTFNLEATKSLARMVGGWRILVFLTA